jgi:hypothetical protein
MAPEERKQKQHEIVGLLIGAAVCYGLYRGYEWVVRPSLNVTSLGMIRLVSCDYQGDFVGGIGYDCVVHNYSNGLRNPQMSCASYDDANRMIGAPDQNTNLALSHTPFNPGEERVIRVYFADKTKRAVCSETGDFPLLDELDRDQQRNISAGIVSELHL